jgi:hypothetical protein
MTRVAALDPAMQSVAALNGPMMRVAALDSTMNAVARLDGPMQSVAAILAVRFAILSASRAYPKAERPLTV